MILDIRVAVFAVADTLLDILDQYLADKVDETHDNFLLLSGKDGYLHFLSGLDHDLIVEDFFPYHALAGVEERRFLEDDFEEDAPEGPNVRLLPANVIRK